MNARYVIIYRYGSRSKQKLKPRAKLTQSDRGFCHQFCSLEEIGKQWHILRCWQKRYISFHWLPSHSHSIYVRTCNSGTVLVGNGPTVHRRDTEYSTIILSLGFYNTSKLDRTLNIYMAIFLSQSFQTRRIGSGDMTLRHRKRWCAEEFFLPPHLQSCHNWLLPCTEVKSE